jgi:hypothetical protein
MVKRLEELKTKNQTPQVVEEINYLEDLMKKIGRIGKATSSYTREMVEARLADLLAGPQTEETRREIQYLEDLKIRKGL